MLRPDIESEPSYLMTNRRMPLRTLRLFLLSTAIVIFGVVKTRAGGPVVWETDSRAQLLSGESRGVSVTDTGALMLAPRFTQVFDTEQAYVWSSAADAAGNVYLGTGHDGRIFRAGADGRRLARRRHGRHGQALPRARGGREARNVGSHRHQRDARHLARVRPR